ARCTGPNTAPAPVRSAPPGLDVLPRATSVSAASRRTTRTSLRRRVSLIGAYSPLGRGHAVRCDPSAALVGAVAGRRCAQSATRAPSATRASSVTRLGDQDLLQRLELLDAL